MVNSVVLLVQLDSFHCQTCTGCPAGSYSDVTDAVCIPCAAGKYSTIHAGFCEDCPAGFYSLKGQPLCQLCSPGTFSTSGSTICTECPMGDYSGPGSSMCQSCSEWRLLASYEKCINQNASSCMKRRHTIIESFIAQVSFCCCLLSLAWFVQLLYDENIYITNFFISIPLLYL